MKVNGFVDLYFFQNERVNRRMTVYSSRRPVSIMKLNIHLAASGIKEKQLTPFCMSAPIPEFDIAESERKKPSFIGTPSMVRTNPPPKITRK